MKRHPRIIEYINTIYKSDSNEGYSHYTGVSIKEAATQTVIKNNLIHLPSSGDLVEMIQNDSSDLIADHNLLTDNPGLVDPDNSDFLMKDFSLMSDSPAIDAGSSAPVFDDFTGNIRPENVNYDLGAFEFGFAETN